MTPKEKAEELFKKYNPHVLQRDFFGDDVEKIKTKQCALISVDEILKAFWYTHKNESEYRYWQEVKQEIEAL